MGWIESDYVDAEALAFALAESLVESCRSALHARGTATLALAGGRTPFPAYQKLAEHALDWSNIRIVATDERCVAIDHSARNSNELRRVFASAKGLQIVELASDDGAAESSLASARVALAAIQAPFDAVLLGMGADAHTASLFPGAENLSAAMAESASDAYRIDPTPLPPDAPFSRVTLSLPRLLNTRALHLAITGEAKRSVMRQAQQTHDTLAMPISAVLHASAPIAVHKYIHWSP